MKQSKRERREEENRMEMYNIDSEPCRKVILKTFTFQNFEKIFQKKI